MFAQRSSLGCPVDVKFGSNGQHYFADTGANKVWRLSVNGYAREVVRDTRYFGLHGLGGLAIRGSADGANGLIMDTRGNLCLSGSATKTLLVVKPNGMLTRRFGSKGFYPRGNSGFSRLPSGEIIAIDNQSIVKIDKTSINRIVDFQHRKLADGIRVFQPNGIAVSRNGTIYCDTYPSNGYSNVSALIALGQPDTITILWDS